MDSDTISPRMLHRVAQCIQSSDVRTFGREYLKVPDIEVTNALDQITETLRDYVYEGLQISIRRHRTTVDDMTRILEKYNENYPDDTIDIEEVGLKAIDGNQILPKPVVNKLTRCFSTESWKIFCENYLHIKLNVILSKFPMLHVSAQEKFKAILVKWVNRDREAATRQRLIRLLEKASRAGIDTSLAIGELQKESDDSETLAEDLRVIYRQRYKNIRPLHWEQDAPYYNLNNIFIPIKGQVTPDPTTERSKSSPFPLTDILNQAVDENTLASVTLVEGVSGSGKTTLCRKLALQWAALEPGMGTLEKLDCMFLIDGQELRSAPTIASYIAGQVLGSANKARRVQAVLETADINNKPVLLVIDGFDSEVYNHEEIRMILNRQMYTGLTVMLTARVGLCNEDIKALCDLRVTINDLTNDDIDEAMNSRFVIEDRMTSIFTDDNPVQTHKDRGLAQTPLNLLLLCSIAVGFRRGAYITATELPINDVIDISLFRTKNTFQINDTEMKNTLEDLSSMAHECVKEQSLIIDVPTMPESTLKTGLVQRQSQPNVRYEVRHEFVQGQICDYLAAYYIQMQTCQRQSIWCCIKNPKILDMLTNIPDFSTSSKRLSSNTLSYLCSMLGHGGFVDELNQLYNEVLLPAIRQTNTSAHNDGGHAALLFLIDAGTEVRQSLVESITWDQDIVLTKHCHLCAKAVRVIIEDEAAAIDISKIRINSEVLEKEDSLCRLTNTETKLALCIDNDKELARCCGENGILPEVNRLEELLVQRQRVH